MQSSNCAPRDIRKDDVREVCELRRFSFWAEHNLATKPRGLFYFIKSCCKFFVRKPKENDRETAPAPPYPWFYLRRILKKLTKPCENLSVGKFNPDIVLIKNISKNKFPHFWTWIMDSGPFRLVPGRKFHVESEFRVKFSGFRRLGAKI